MIQQEYRDRAHRKENAMNAALRGVGIAGVAGLLAAYQPWGRQITRFLGRVVDTTKVTRAASQFIRQGEGFHHYTKTDFRQYYNNLKTAWAESAAHVDEIKLNPDHHGSIAGLIRDTEEAVRGARRTAEYIWKQDFLVKEAVEHVKGTNLNENQKDSLISFIREAVNYADNLAKQNEIARQRNLQGQVMDVASQISRDLKMKYEATKGIDGSGKGDGSIHDKSQFIKQLTDTLKRDIRANAYSIDTLEQVLGTANNQGWVDGSIELITRAHKMTWQELKNLGTKVKDVHLRVGKDDTDIVTLKEVMESIEDIHRGNSDSYKRLMQITVDQSHLFISNSGQAFSKEISSQLWKDFLAVTRNTLPGKLFKIGDLDNALRIPDIQIIRQTAQDPVFMDKVSNAGESDLYHYRIGERIYSLDLSKPEGQTSYLNAQLNDGSIKFVSGRYGFYHTQIEAMRGMTRTKKSDNRLFNILDIFQDREEYQGSVIDDTVSMFLGENKRRKRLFGMINMSAEEYDRHINALNELDFFIGLGSSDWEKISDSTRDYIREYIETGRKISTIFQQSSHKINLGAIEEILQNDQLNEQSRKMFQLIKDNDTDKMIQAIITDGFGRLSYGIKIADRDKVVPFLNRDLQLLADHLMMMGDSARTRIDLVTTEERLAYGSDLINLFRAPMGNETYKLPDVLRKEIAKEALLRQGLEEDIIFGVPQLNYDRINDLLDTTLTLNEHNRKELDILSQYGIWQYETNINRSMGHEEDMFYRIGTKTRDFSRVMKCRQ